ncbi:MAG: porin [Desulfobacca sp.]|nr:porin [Desulfobacca sp.]
MRAWPKLWGVGLLILVLIFPVRSALAINAEDLLDLLVEEKVITPDKAQKLKEKAEQLDRARQSREAAERAQELEQIKQEAKAEAIKEAKKAVPKPKVEVGYKKGFFMQTPDDKFKMRIRLGLQPRYTYLNRDKSVIAADRTLRDTSSNAYFKFRRLRLFFDGNAFDKDLNYMFHIQLEPNQQVNVHDAYVYYSGLKYLQPWIGRGKVAYGLEFWQSGWGLNFVERSIFSGETDQPWPGGNAEFNGPAGSTGIGNNRYNTGGFNVYRSQGFMLMGDLDLWAPRNLRYWAGIWNGPNTRGTDNMNDAEFLYTGRLLFAPLPNGGPDDAELFMQGDYKNHTGWPMFYVLGSLFTNRDKNRSNRPGRDPVTGDALPQETYDTANHGFDLAAVFKWHGFSLQAEWARETFTEFRPNVFIPGQLGQGHRTGHREAWYVAGGYFILPQRLEAVVRYAYANRVQNADNPYTWSFLATDANQTNYLVQVDQAGNFAREGILREYTAGLNLYVNGHNQKYQVDYSRLIREFYGGSNQEDNRFRLTAYWLF